MILLSYADELVPYVRVGQERWTPRATRYLASRDALALAILSAARRAGQSEPNGDSPWEIRVTVRRRTRRAYDLDNVVKAVMDAANRIVWADDAQVVRIIANKGQPGADDLSAEFCPL